jgi:hypothetical protein
LACQELWFKKKCHALNLFFQFFFLFLEKKGLEGNHKGGGAFFRERNAEFGIFRSTGITIGTF